MSMTHKQAVQRIAKWLQFNQRCLIVATELSTACHETPDAIGFHGHAHSILVEVKVSRADFLADGGKQFRQLPDLGMGDVRYFAAPPGVIKPEDDLEDWGHLEILERQIKVIRKPQAQTANKRAEVKLLMSVIRRLQISTAVFVRPDEGGLE